MASRKGKPHRVGPGRHPGAGPPPGQRRRVRARGVAPASRDSDAAVASAKGAAPPSGPEGELEFLRATSEAYKALVRNMRWSFQWNGLDVRAAGDADHPPEKIEGLRPSLSVRSDEGVFLLECATGPMLKSPHLAERLKTFSRVKGANLWLVVPFDVLAEARGLVADLEGVGKSWKVVPGDG